MRIIIAILVFCLIILIHEFGHFIVAKACGIYVREFALGMGPVLLRKQGKETLYTIRLFPVGGFCSMDGEDGGYDEDAVQEINPRAFNRKPVWQRMLVILAGPVMNLVLGFVVVIISLCTADAIASTVISDFREAPVSCEYLKVDDKILSIEGTPIFSASDIGYKLQSGNRKNAEGNLVFDFKVKRGGETVLLKDVEFATTEGEDSTGVYLDFYVYPLKKTVGNVIASGFTESVSIGRLMIMSLLDLIRGKYGLNYLSGPVGVVQIVTESVAYGFSTFMSLVALISINVAVMNLLPIPALDGCRFLFLLIEAIRRKPMKPEAEGLVHFIGLAALMVLMVVLTINDVMRIITGG